MRVVIVKILDHLPVCGSASAIPGSLAAEASAQLLAL